MRTVFDKFMDEMDFKNSIEWNPEWTENLGVETAVDYVSGLVDLDNLDYLDVNKHKKFTGFVKVDSSMDSFLVEGDMGVYYLKDGAIKYLQDGFGEGRKYQRNVFVDNNFFLVKDYFGEGKDIPLLLGFVGIKKFFSYGEGLVIYKRFNNLAGELEIHTTGKGTKKIPLLGEDAYFFKDKDFLNYKTFYRKMMEFRGWHVLAGVE